MRTVADVGPQGHEPGLRAFMCDGCCLTDSVLVHREERRPQSKDTAEAAKAVGHGGELLR